MRRVKLRAATILLTTMAAAVCTGSLAAQRPSVDARLIGMDQIAEDAASFTLGKDDYGAEWRMHLTWHVTLRDDCDSDAPTVAPSRLWPSSGYCLGRQYLSAQIPGQPGTSRAYELRNLPFVDYIEVVASRQHARLRLHLANTSAEADTLFHVSRGDVVLLDLDPDHLRVVESVGGLEPPTRVDADTSMVRPSWTDDSIYPNYLEITFFAGVSPAVRDSLLDQPGLQVLRVEHGRLVEVRVFGDADACRLRDVMDYFETKPEVMFASTPGRLCGNVEDMTQCPARKGSPCGS